MYMTDVLLVLTGISFQLNDPTSWDRPALATKEEPNERSQWLHVTTHLFPRRYCGCRLRKL